MGLGVIDFLHSAATKWVWVFCYISWIYTVNTYWLKKKEEHFNALFKILKTCTTVTEVVLTVTSGKVFLMRLNILLWDCRSPIVRGSLAPSFVLPFDFSFRSFPSRTAFTYGEKTQLTFHMLREFKGSRCTQRYTFGFFRDYTLIVSKANG